MTPEQFAIVNKKLDALTALVNLLLSDVDTIKKKKEGK